MVLASAPYTFTKLLKPVCQSLRSKRMVLVHYLDNFLIISSSCKECFVHTQLCTTLLNSLSFVINTEKSVFSPTTKFTFLGFIFDSLKMTVELPMDKRKRTLKWVILFLRGTSCKIKLFAQFVNLLTSARPAVKCCWLCKTI